MTEININNNFEYNKKYEQLELLLQKLQVEIATKNIEISRLQNKIQHFRKNIKDTSGNFPLPDEFKNRWETLMKTSIMDTFENISFNPILLMKTINIITQYLYEISIEKINHKISDILICLGMDSNKEENIKYFFEKFKILIFQDYFNTIFKIRNEEFSKSIISNIKNEFIFKQSKLFSKEDIQYILKDLNSKNIKNFVVELYNLFLYMNINEPQLFIKTSINENYKYFSKKKFSNIEGFSKENDICLLILNPPMTKNHINYKGIKPTVYILENPNKEIKELCLKQNNDINSKNEIIDYPKSFTKTTNYINYFKNNNKIKSELSIHQKSKYQSNSNIFLKNNNSTNNFKYFKSLNSTFIEKIDNSYKDKIYSKDDFNYKYKFKNILKYRISQRKYKSYKSAFLNINRNKLKKIYHLMKISQNNLILNKIRNLKKNKARNINLLSFQEHNLQKNINKTSKNLEQKKSKYNKSSSPISPKKSPSFFLSKERNNAKRLISMINTRNQQKFPTYKSEKFLNRNLKKEGLNKERKKYFKIKNIKEFQEFSSYLRKRNKYDKKNNEGEGKTELNDILKQNNENISDLKDTSIIIKNGKFYDRKNSNNISTKMPIIYCKNKTNQSEPIFSALTEDMKTSKRYIQIPNKNNNKIIQKENGFIKIYNNNKNKNSINYLSCLNTNSNLITNNNYKTNNNSLLSNNDTLYYYIKNNFKNNIHTSSNNVKKELKNASNSSEKHQYKYKNLSSNGKRLKKKKYIFNMNNKIENKKEQNNIKKDENKNNSIYNSHAKESNKEISYISIITSNSQINIGPNKRINIRPETQIEIFKKKKKFEKTSVFLHKRIINGINKSNGKNKKFENIYNIKINTEKNINKDKYIDSLRNYNKESKNNKHKKIEFNDYYK